MREQLLTDAFNKAKKNSTSSSALGLATHIYDALELKCKQPTSADAIRGYYRKWENKESFNISNTAKDHLALYLDFEDYKSYLESKNTKTINTKRYQYALLVLFLVVAFFIYDATRKKCMIWDETKFVKIHCEETNAKPIDPVLLTKFKKVEAECREDFFFDRDGSPKIWYYKQGKKNLELFTHPGIHPNNGKTLNAITGYMITEHICTSLL
ncbi:hypothetical protein [Rasiella sp. SM2506]|uniref:hypothetical protein n=1 Tax=Rasiella sp. SM2506 TaxID=3423914 RepID=UPI003D7999EE